ncbi:MAG: hypothetical protein ACYCVG_01705 [Leptospirillum sp.]
MDEIHLKELSHGSWRWFNADIGGKAALPRLEVQSPVSPIHAPPAALSLQVSLVLSLDPARLYPRTIATESVLFRKDPNAFAELDGARWPISLRFGPSPSPRSPTNGFIKKSNKFLTSL